MRFLSLTPFFALPALLVAARQPNDVPPDPSYYDAPSAINHGHEATLDAQKVQQDPWGNGPLVKRWQQWVRRQDTESSDDDKTTETKSETQKTEETTQDEPTTTEEKTTTTEDKPTTTDEPTSTTEESTTQETTTQQSSSTVESTSTESSASSTSTSSSSITATEPGASCYSTTVSTSVVCSITTDGRTESASCITNRMTSSTCSPGLFCTIHPDSGATVCMEQHNEIGTEGIVVATFFGACIAGCMAVLVGMCLRDKKREKKWQSIQRVRTLKQAKREERTNLMAGATPPNVI
ncbi:hypothetical protein FVEG_13268 [Fusarium verticillioides 7600]|uniref:Extracellular membrane protein CFEM domain-containing protein n=1 Tax=Gibberella moniliformis (strain M3125 / FGSC 7600) TaxID=334819 RepID=W7N555_GIBM7|nr:hypothetical protein FVEG_13268 [Fusarium verticillioides 7600]EWG55235.1 hypothetical protein FVEG_13268 [Fusarium verticillioides 7600]RBQ84081.1 hypothetical protein FVER53263_13268 [Fusarium verticillioides]